ncbi:hypothetical protein [Prosthecobacter sp.]|uniref:hypothetical protein n=1 Tax=Prosthecobacter sp. TaxID=1965333 RepID=UPI003784B17C
MKQPLSELLRKAAQSLPPQRPGRFRPLLPLFLAMAEKGHTPGSMADFLVAEREIRPAERRAAARSIQNLVARHSS